MKLDLYSTILCPHCGFSKTEQMSINACQYLYESVGCKKLLKPREGDCCVFCSYGTVKCPPIQESGGSCKTC